MNDIRKERREESAEIPVPAQGFGQVAGDLYEKALTEAKEQLHPLMRNAEVYRFRKRNDIVSNNGAGRVSKGVNRSWRFNKSHRMSFVMALVMVQCFMLSTVYR